MRVFRNGWVSLCTQGHICVNGGGKFGGMGALNRSLKDSHGKVGGVARPRCCLHAQAGYPAVWGQERTLKAWFIACSAH